MSHQLQLQSPDRLHIPNATELSTAGGSGAGFSEARPCRTFAGVAADTRATPTALGPRWHRTTFFTSTDSRRHPLSPARTFPFCSCSVFLPTTLLASRHLLHGHSIHNVYGLPHPDPRLLGVGAQCKQRPALDCQCQFPAPNPHQRPRSLHHAAQAVQAPGPAIDRMDVHLLTLFSGNSSPRSPFSVPPVALASRCPSSSSSTPGSPSSPSTTSAAPLVRHGLPKTNNMPAR